MAATRCSGTNAVRYGTMKDNVLALKVVLANGEVMTTARRAKKSSAGYDLTRLIVGSEGTLGVITELTLKLHGIPEAIAGGVCPFPTVEACCNATITTIQSGIPVARIELLDEVQVKAVNPIPSSTLPETPMLFARVPRHRGGRRRAVAALRRDRREFGGGPFEWTTRPRSARGSGRRATTPTGRPALRPGAKMLSTDVCVPISRLAECVGRDAGRHRGDRAARADRRPRRRRQFPS
jgi:D-lactate dehydrogenase (cytochrome)